MRPSGSLPALLLLLCALLRADPGRTPAAPAAPSTPTGSGEEPALLEGTKARQERRTRLAVDLGKEFALVLGQPPTDVLQPRQQGHLLYLADCEEAGAALLLAGVDATAEFREILFVRDWNPRFAQFFGARLRPGAESALALGLEEVRGCGAGGAELAKRIAPLLPPEARLHLPAYAGGDDVAVRELRNVFLEEMGQLRADLVIEDLHPRLVAMRAVKDRHEIACLERSIALTLAAFHHILPRIRAGGGEGEIEGQLLASMRTAGARAAYPFVVAAGRNSVYPHYFLNDASLAEGDLLLLDAGGAYRRYAADITRTFPISGQFTPRQREIYDLVLEAQRAALATVRAGVRLGEVDAAARRVIVGAGYGKHFLHGTCHHVGLDVHDPGPALLTPGMTITVEPGIYIEEESIGVRIEDVVVVTEKGCRNLSESFPTDAAAIQQLLAAARAAR